jgi:hypothetical protein
MQIIADLTGSGSASTSTATLLLRSTCTKNTNDAVKEHIHKYTNNTIHIHEVDFKQGT